MARWRDVHREAAAAVVGGDEAPQLGIAFRRVGGVTDEEVVEVVPGAAVLVLATGAGQPHVQLQGVVAVEVAEVDVGEDVAVGCHAVEGPDHAGSIAGMAAFQVPLVVVVEGLVGQEPELRVAAPRGHVAEVAHLADVLKAVDAHGQHRAVVDQRRQPGPGGAGGAVT